jgi:hypothetical protein
MNEREVKQQGILYNDLEIWQYELDYMPLHILQSSMLCNDNKLVKVIVILEECKINLTLKIKKKS